MDLVIMMKEDAEMKDLHFLQAFIHHRYFSNSTNIDFVLFCF